MIAIREPKDVGEGFKYLGELRREVGTVQFLRICLHLCKEPSGAGTWGKRCLGLGAVSGLFGRPTVVNNVVPLATGLMIRADVREKHAVLESTRLRVTACIQIAGNVLRDDMD